jgi:LPS-assembly protein
MAFMLRSVTARTRRKLRLCALVLLMSVMAVSSSFSAENAAVKNRPASDSPALITADAMNYDEKSTEVTALGHVEISQNGRIVLADKVTYNKQRNTVKATGNVSMLETNGDVFFAKDMELKDDMKTAMISHFKARLSDNSLLAANSATRNGRGHTILRKAVYSPCPVCDDKAPVWQIKAGKVMVNEEKQQITYNNAFLEAYGVPVFYTPYFSHATPNADRKSGFLTPTYSTITSLGSTVKTPYYVNIASNMDATITPYLTSSQGPVLIANFRHLTSYGSYEFTGSITNPDEYRLNRTAASDGGNKLRGHIEGSGRFTLKDDWVSGFAVKRTTDDTYLRRYRFGEEDYLTSRIYTEHIENRNFLSIQGVSFQDLKQVSQTTSPLVLPLIDSHMESDPGVLGSRFKLDSDVAAILRNEGTDTKRLSVTGSWNVPYVSDFGQVMGLTTSLRGDAYSVNDGQFMPSGIVTTPGTSNYDGTPSRMIPEARIDWRYPLINPRQDFNIVIEPIANVIVSTTGNNPQEIPNEDSQSVELTDANLFNSNHFPGFDRVETGPRANYGIQSSIQRNAGGTLNMLFGQNYRVYQDSNFKLGSGMDNRFSDYVGKIDVSPNGKFDLAYHFRFDKDTLSVHRNEVTTTAVLTPVTLNLSYLSLNENILGNNPDRKEIYGAVSTVLSKKWTITADGRKNLADNGGLISTGATLLYHGDCVDFNTSLLKQYTEDRDVKPTTAITFQIFLKNLNKPPVR